jgi:1,4-dihydroxy-2-naphthoate octaprenyltransferase
VTASGLLEASAIKRGAMICFALAALMGLYLVAVGGWPILLLGIFSILSGWAYTGGPMPIAYSPLGELFVVIFFGLGAVCGVYWLCTGTLNAATVETGLAIGLLAGAVLLVNNHRDAEADARVGRRTLAIVAGPSFTTLIYAGLMLSPFALLLPIGDRLPRGFVWPALIALPVALGMIYYFVREPRGRAFNRILVQTVFTQFLFGMLLSVGLVL